MSNWPVSLADIGRRQEQQPVLVEEFAGSERLDRVEMLGVAGQFLLSSAAVAALVSSGVGASITARIVRSRSNAWSN